MSNYMNNLRINEKEKEVIRKVSISINKKLVNMGKMPMKESELVHKILYQALKKVEINENGEIKI